MGYQEEKICSNLKSPQETKSWVMMESCDHREEEDVLSQISESMGSSQENIDSINSIDSSSCSSELLEDACSSPSSSKSSSSSSTISSLSSLSNGPLYELSELLVHLPLRRGLSKFYQGKSQSFTSLATVKSSEDLPKKVAPFRKKKIMKQCKSFHGDLDIHKLHSPKSVVIAKKSRASSFLSSHLWKL